ncbi:DUF4123 domain-containing protein [Rhizobium sp. A22-96]
MDAAPLDTADTDETSRVFQAALDAMPRPLFAVLDGGHFDDLEDELAEAGIMSRSLFLKGGDTAMRRDGPWLVTLRDRKTHEHVERLALEKPCAVFWSCPDGEQALWRHLRSINQVLVPDDRVPENNGQAGKSIAYERVLFRHWDPNVLGSFMPLLSVKQFARVLGPATAILTKVTDTGRFKRALRPKNLPEAPKGPLRFELAQIEPVSKAKFRVMNERVSEYLCSVAEEKTKEFSGDEFSAFVENSIKESSDLGVTSEGAHCRWAYMKLVSGGRITASPHVIGAMRADDIDMPPNERVKILMQKIIQEMRGG